MTVIPFPRPQQHEVGGWTSSEYATLQEALMFINRFHPQIELVVGVAEDGTPWAVLNNSAGGLTFFHINRTPDGVYNFGAVGREVTIWRQQDDLRSILAERQYIAAQETA